jgi:hypothetical protein
VVDKVDDKQDDTVASFNEGFLEGIDDTVDPLDFADKPETPPKKEVVAEADEPVEQDETEGEEETPPVVAEKEEPAKEEPKAPLTKDRADEIYDLLEKRLPKEQPLEQPKAPEPAAKKEPEPEKPALTEEEVARLKELNTEWKDVSEMVALQLKSVADTISKEVAKQVAEIKRDVEQRIQPVQQSVELSAAERYDSAVREVHPEVYDPAASKAFGDELVEWVQKQPKYLQTAYTQAFESPDPQDAIDLITRFKNETGKVKEPEGEPEPAAAPVETTAEADKNKRLQLLKKPTSRQTKGADGDDPLDFEGGFKEMVREMSRAG